MNKQECIGIPDMILLLMKDWSRNRTESRSGLFLNILSNIVWGTKYIVRTNISIVHFLDYFYNRQ